MCSKSKSPLSNSPSLPPPPSPPLPTHRHLFFRGVLHTKAAPMGDGGAWTNFVPVNSHLSTCCRGLYLVNMEGLYLFTRSSGSLCPVRWTSFKTKLQLFYESTIWYLILIGWNCVFSQSVQLSTALVCHASNLILCVWRCVRLKVLMLLPLCRDRLGGCKSLLWILTVMHQEFWWKPVCQQYYSIIVYSSSVSLSSADVFAV